MTPLFAVAVGPATGSAGTGAAVEWRREMDWGKRPAAGEQQSAVEERECAAVAVVVVAVVVEGVVTAGSLGKGQTDLQTAVAQKG